MSPPAATVFSSAGADWAAHVLVGDSILGMPEIGQSVPLLELYEGLVLDPSEDTEARDKSE